MEKDIIRLCEGVKRTGHRLYVQTLEDSISLVVFKYTKGVIKYESPIFQVGGATSSVEQPRMLAELEELLIRKGFYISEQGGQNLPNKKK